MKRFIVLLAALAVIAAACDSGEHFVDECGPDRCGNLQATVERIDWLGDSTPPDTTESLAGVEPDLPLQTNVWFSDLPDAEATRQEIVGRLEDAGFRTVAEGGGGSQFRGTEWQTTIAVIFGEGPLDNVQVTVDIVDDDARAAEILAPISDALGTIP